MTISVNPQEVHVVRSHNEGLDQRPAPGPPLAAFRGQVAGHPPARGKIDATHR